MNRYRIMGLIAAIAAAAVCFWAYAAVKRGETPPYGAVFAIASAGFAAIATSELLISKKNKATGAFAYFKPAFFYLIAAASLTAAVWFFVK